MNGYDAVMLKYKYHELAADAARAQSVAQQQADFMATLSDEEAAEFRKMRRLLAAKLKDEKRFYAPDEFLDLCVATWAHLEFAAWAHVE